MDHEIGREIMRVILCVIAMGLFASIARADDSLNVSGLWVVESGNAIVQMTDCGDGTPCGYIVWVEAPVDAMPKDTNNPDPALRDEPLVGSKLLWAFKARDDKWTSGKIYDAESGKTYKSKIEIMENGALKVKGCVGPVCQGQVWTPVKLID